MNILGISAFYHDSAACLVRNGEIIAAAQEERFTRIKHDHRFPKHAIDYCLSAGNITGKDIDYIAFYEDSSLKFDRLFKTYLAYAPRGVQSFLTAMPLWLTEKLWIKQKIRREIGYTGEIITPKHHESHAASAFYPSPFQSAAFLTMDGVGEWATMSFGVGSGNSITIKREIRFPHSLGLLYSAFTYYAGFKVNSGEYKLMGLAPYGRPKYINLIYDNLVDVKDDGSFHLNMDFFNYPVGNTMTNDRFHKLFGRPPRKPETEITQMDMDLARSIQVVTEDIILKISAQVKKVTGEKNLCLAGGVALNCVANGKILQSKLFDNVWIQPASGDAGGALGAALFVWYQQLKSRRKPKKVDSQKGSYLGCEYKNKDIKSYLESKNIPYTFFQKDKLFAKVAQLIAQQKVVGWFQGRMEYGPRALGARSILGDARSENMQRTMNLKIKFRESFRPFAPAVLSEKVDEWFEAGRKEKVRSPYMLITAQIRKSKQKKRSPKDKKLVGLEKLNVARSAIPAVTHVDYSARIQTVHKNTNPVFHSLLTAFYKRTKCPVIVNTSFNVRGEPIVESPEDAYQCFMRTKMDYLVLGNFLLEKNKQPPTSESIDWQRKFKLD